jgi:hypothetical protein
VSMPGADEFVLTIACPDRPGIVYRAIRHSFRAIRHLFRAIRHLFLDIRHLFLGIRLIFAIFERAAAACRAVT